MKISLFFPLLIGLVGMAAPAGASLITYHRDPQSVARKEWPLATCGRSDLRHPGLTATSRSGLLEALIRTVQAYDLGLRQRFCRIARGDMSPGRDQDP